MSSSSSAHPSSQPTPRQRQQWEVAVLTSGLPAPVAPLVAAALLAPGPRSLYTPLAWEPMQRYGERVIAGRALAALREMLRRELRQARSLVWTPLDDLPCLKRNAPLAVHAARLAQITWELERRPGVRAAEEARQATGS
jgi:hypothetical protein